MAESDRCPGILQSRYSSCSGARICQPDLRNVVLSQSEAVSRVAINCREKVRIRGQEGCGGRLTVVGLPRNREEAIRVDRRLPVLRSDDDGGRIQKAIG